MGISKTASAYLNAVRFLAASAVVLYHFHDKHFGPDKITRFFPSNGRGYVIIFFVISGFVISMAAERKSALEFAIDRSVRIYIVALPVLVITALLASYFPDASDEYGQALNEPVSTFILNATFLSQSWDLEYFPFLDGPYWSLCYEVMYYFIFAAYTYARGNLRWPLVITACAIAGPKILVLFPCWLAGVAAYKLRHVSADQKIGWLAFAASPLVLVIAFQLGLKDVTNGLSDYFYAPGTLSSGFIRGWFVALAFSVHLWGACQIRISVPDLIHKVSAALAGTSYSLYLLHLPVLYMLACTSGERSSSWFLASSIPIVFVVCIIFSKITEANRGWVRLQIEAVFAIRRPSSPTV